MANELQKFMKKIGKLDKNDYTIEIRPVENSLEYLVEFHVVLLDYDNEFKVPVDYENKDRVDNLMMWLQKESDGYELSGRHKPYYYRYYFDADKFVVSLEYLSCRYE